MKPKRPNATMFVTLTVAAILVASATPTRVAAQATVVGVGSEDVHHFRAVGDVALSPDGGRVAYTVQNRERPGRPYNEIWWLDLATGESRPLDGVGSSPLWSPDGRWLAYRGSDGQRSGLIVANSDGSGPRFVAEIRGTNHPLPGTGSSMTWAPDSNRIAFVSAVDGPEPQEASAEGDPIVIRRYLYRTTGSDGTSYFNDNRRLHIFIVDIATGTTRQLTDGPHYNHSIAWSPNGEEIVFVSNREPDPDRFFNYDVFAVRVSDGSERRLTHRESVVYRPAWSPDGRRVAFQGTTRGLTSSETTMEDTHIWIMNADGSDQREVGSIDNRQGAPTWSRDGQFIYFTVLERGNTALYRVAPDGGSAPSPIIAERGRVGSYAIAPNGDVIFGFHTPDDLAQLFRLQDHDRRQLTRLNEKLLATRSIAPVVDLRFVAFDGLEIEAFVTMPHGRSEGSSHPMIVMIKGGPHSQQGPVLDLKAQAYASQGWATLMVNYRGSTGYGQAFTDAIFGDQNGREALDVLQGTDAALRRFSWIDRDRVGVEGGSYGGQLSNWLVTQTDRYAAAIPRASISNLISFNYLSYYHDYLAVEFGGFPHQGDLMDVLWERSPLKHVARVRTPVMLVHGLNDHNVPRAEAEQFFIALKDVGVEAELVLYPRAGHGISESRQLVDLTDRSISWYRRHFAQRTRSSSDLTSR
jgi:dipeptidyl aminopeptidase/acylaminoacyl peptidase